jgi:4-hydroxythreonine-4-phosphate dehydrogenase
MKPAVAITVGDYNGIGPEVILKSIRHPAVRHICVPVLVGPSQVFEFYASKLHIALRLHAISPESSGPAPILRNAPSRSVFVVENRINNGLSISPGSISVDAGIIASQAIEVAAHLAQAGTVQAMVTAPVSKLALHKAGISHPGQTELLQDLTSSPHVAMMLASTTMRVGLVTIHVPLAEVARNITKELVCERVRTIYEALRTDWRVRKPKLAVLGLNPHAGEGGDIGREEETTIQPALRELRSAGIDIAGPFPADSFFGMYKPGMYDAVVAMYHDQGLIPLKMSSFGKGVNVSLGLPIVRTSPDHGTAFELAGKGKADPGSTIEAIKLAVLIAENRRKAQRRKAG